MNLLSKVSVLACCLSINVLVAMQTTDSAFDGSRTKREEPLCPPPGSDLGENFGCLLDSAPSPKVIVESIESAASTNDKNKILEALRTEDYSLYCEVASLLEIRDLVNFLSTLSLDLCSLDMEQLNQSLQPASYRALKDALESNNQAKDSSSSAAVGERRQPKFASRFRQASCEAAKQEAADQVSGCQDDDA